MKKLIIIIFALCVTLASCKKDDLTLTELLGTWTEIQPCVRDSSLCYTLQFANNNIVYESSPFIDTGYYALMNNNTIRIDSDIVWPGWQFTGSLVFQLATDSNNNELIIKKFYTPLGSFGITPNPVYDIHLMKI